LFLAAVLPCLPPRVSESVSVLGRTDCQNVPSAVQRLADYHGRRARCLFAVGRSFPERAP
jgi:hypothetical protein